MVTKAVVFEKLDRFPRACRGFEPKGIRLTQATNYGLDKEEWRIWVVGPGSVDETLNAATDTLIIKNYHSLDRAMKDLAKFRKWFAEWQNENS
ncbi:hypothetical protein POP15_062 [Pectobacterium phage POP15]|nr:hypothetical protein POP15_062 [Pectobacterium phage POP15]